MQYITLSDITVTDVGGLYRNCVTWNFLQHRNNMKLVAKQLWIKKAKKLYCLFHTIWGPWMWYFIVIGIVAWLGRFLGCVFFAILTKKKTSGLLISLSKQCHNQYKKWSFSQNCTDILLIEWFAFPRKLSVYLCIRVVLPRFHLCLNYQISITRSCIQEAYYSWEMDIFCTSYYYGWYLLSELKLVCTGKCEYQCFVY